MRSPEGSNAQDFNFMLIGAELSIKAPKVTSDFPMALPGEQVPSERIITILCPAQDQFQQTAPSPFEVSGQTEVEPPEGTEIEPSRVDNSGNIYTPEKKDSKETDYKERKEVRDEVEEGLLNWLKKHRADLMAALATGAAVVAIGQTYVASEREDRMEEMELRANERDDGLAILAHESAARESRAEEAAKRQGERDQVVLGIEQNRMLREMTDETLRLREILYKKENGEIAATYAERQTALLRLIEIEREIELIKMKKIKENKGVTVKGSDKGVEFFFNQREPTEIVFRDPEPNVSGELISQVTVKTSERDLEYLMPFEKSKLKSISVFGPTGKTDSNSKKTNSGKLESIIFLGMKRKIDLTKFDFPYAKLKNVDLSDINLQDAVLHDSILDHAILMNTNLIGANLKSASLYNADLSASWLGNTNFKGASLWNANLTEARLSGANLDGANLDGTILNGADLSGAKNLTQEQLNQACGDEKTKLPEGLTIPLCKKNEG